SAPGAKLALVRAATSPPSDVLRLSGMSRKKSHKGRNSKGSLERRSRDGLNGAASPFKARDARTSRGRRLPRETLDRSSVRELAAARSPAGAHAVRTRRKGVPGGGVGGSCSARRTSKVGLGKMDERQAQHDTAKFGAMILEIARDPASGRSDSRALLSRRTVARR
ncbi:hypothetical protein T492DRAFT_1021638, partial [Pavlovales sp. CCMP2436]